MRALVYHGPGDIRLDDVPKPAGTCDGCSSPFSRAGRQSVALRFIARERTALGHVRVLEDLLRQPWNDDERGEVEA